MNNAKRLSVVILTMILLLGSLPLTVSANSPEPTPFYTFYLSNLPENAEYVDLLIQLSETDKMYTNLNSENIPGSFSSDAQILSYCEDGYRSYTFHYQNALSMLRIGGEGYVRYFTNSESDWDEAHIRFDHGREIDERGFVKLAVLDNQGNILLISQPLDLTNVSKFSYRLGDYYYDCATGELIIERIENNQLDPPNHYIVSAVIGILLTCLLEWFVGCVCKLGHFRWLILGTNIVSQILMRLAYAAFYLYSTWSYSAITLVLEGCVFLGEFLWYRWRMRDTSWKTVLGFTVGANTVSWALGHVLNTLLFFGSLIMI